MSFIKTEQHNKLKNDMIAIKLIHRHKQYAETAREQFDLEINANYI